MALPGVTTVLQDRFYTISRRDVPSGPNVVAIGYRNTADGTNGVPSLDPFSFQSEQDVINSYGQGSSLHRAYLELVAGGATRISLIALPFGAVDSDLESTSNYSGLTQSLFDAAFDAAEAAQPDIIVPWGRGGHPNEWTTTSQSTPDYPAASPAIPPPMGFQADNSSSSATSLAVRVANKCAEITARSNPVFAVMGLTPYVGVGQYATENVVAGQLGPYLAYPNLISTNDPSFNSCGPYLSVVSTEVRPITYDLSMGYSNGACLYAGYVSTLASYNAPTGKNQYNVSSMRWVATRAQQDTISTNQIVPLAVDYNKVPIWVDAPTYAVPTSDYARLTTLRIIFDAVQMVRQVAQPFVGQGATLANRTSLETAISSGLRGMQQLGALLASDFTVSYSPQSNSAEVDLVLTPAFEMRNIIISVSVNL